DEYHVRMLKTIYKTLTQELECPLQGDHWMKIGFQSAEPKTDLRSTGMFSMLQALAFVDKLNPYAKEIYTDSLSEIFSFSFLSALINLSAISLEALKEGYLIPFCNTYNSILETLNSFYFGIIDHFFTIYKNSNQTLENIHFLLESVSKFAKQNPERIFLLAR